MEEDEETKENGPAGTQMAFKHFFVIRCFFILFLVIKREIATNVGEISFFLSRQQAMRDQCGFPSSLSLHFQAQLATRVNNCFIIVLLASCCFALLTIEVGEKTIESCGRLDLI